MKKGSVLLLISFMFLVACSSSRNIPEISNEQNSAKSVSDQAKANENYGRCTKAIKPNNTWLKGMTRYFTYDRFRQCQNNNYLLELNVSSSEIKNPALKVATVLLRNRISKTNHIPVANVKVKFALPNMKYSSFSGADLKQSGSGGKDVSAKGNGTIVKSKNNIKTRNFIKEIDALFSKEIVNKILKVSMIKRDFSLNSLNTIVLNYYGRYQKLGNVIDSKNARIDEKECIVESGVATNCTVYLLNALKEKKGSIINLKFIVDRTNVDSPTIWLKADGYFEFIEDMNKENFFERLKEKRHSFDGNNNIMKNALQYHINDLYAYIIIRLDRG